MSNENKKDSRTTSEEIKIPDSRNNTDHTEKDLEEEKTDKIPAEAVLSAAESSESSDPDENDEGSVPEKSAEDTRPEESVPESDRAENPEADAADNDVIPSEQGAWSDDEEEAQEVLSGKERRRRRRRGKKKRESGKSGKKGLFIAGGIIGGLLLIYLGISAFFIGHFYINTTINGKDFSGKTIVDVEDYIKQQVDGYELTIVEQNNDRNTIKGSEIGLEYAESSEIQDALDAQNPLLWPAGFFIRSEENVSIGVNYDEALLNEKLQSIKAVTKDQTESVSAYPKYNGTEYVIEPEVYGSAVNTEVLKEKAVQYITEFRDTLNMMDEECYTMPKYTSESEEVQNACDIMNQYIKAQITYTMDEEVVVDKELISQWLSCDDDMNVTFDEDAVAEWMREFGKKYDTVGTTRSITTPDGKQTEVSGGTYGWIVNEAEETQNLIENIKNGETVTKEPEYKQTAASRSEQDWGTTYAEVDISAQKMWYIVDGSVALTSDVVTGLPADDRDTPTGVYSILYTERDSTLKGEIDPATGKPSYETPVAFWMPFTYQGHGFHDATWQAQFGGDWYLSHGSHGCVNMPYDKASQLFEMITAGTPVIIHN